MTRPSGVVAEADPPPLGDVLEFLQLVWGLHHALEKASKRMSSRLGVTGPQRLAIRLVARFPGIPAGRLARLLRLHPSTLSGILKRLERKGLLFRRSDHRDRRRSFLGLTDAGRAIAADQAEEVETAVARVYEKMPSPAMAHARDVLRAVADTVGPKAVADPVPWPGEVVRLRTVP